MKNLKKAGSFALAFMLCLSLVLSFGFNGTAQAADKTVQLVKASIYTYKYGYVSFSGQVEVQNLAYAKKVTIHYTPGNGQWYDTPASYTRAADAANELWDFSISTSSMTTDHPELKNVGTIQFAIKYEVNGQTYWDNNGGQNYSVTNYGMALDSVILGAPNVLLSYDHLYNGSFGGAVYVKNLGYAKNIQITYTTDNWSTKKTVPAVYYYTANGTGSVETWNFDTTVDAGVTKLQYYISYTVNGQTYYDNNYGANYTVSQ